MMVLVDRKFNEEQLLLETFFPKMHFERDIRKKLMSRRLKLPYNKLQVGGREAVVLISHRNGNLMYFNFSSHEKILKFDIF